MKEKENFYNNTLKYFDAGVMREIYSCDNFCICNISNVCYAIYDYKLCQDRGIPFGFALELKYLESIMQNNSLFYEWISKIPEKEINNNVIYCIDKTFEVMKQKKRQTDLNGPLVNLEYEEQLIKDYGSPSHKYK